MAALHQAAPDAFPATGAGQEWHVLGTGREGPQKRAEKGENMLNTAGLFIIYGQLNEIFMTKRFSKREFASFLEETKQVLKVGFRTQT